jgi:hypothetical protein
MTECLYNETVMNITRYSSVREVSLMLSNDVSLLARSSNTVSNGTLVLFKDDTSDK